MLYTTHTYVYIGEEMKIMQTVLHWTTEQPCREFETQLQSLYR